jgi:MFS family permease
MRHRPPSDIRRGLVASTWEGSFAQAFITWTGGVFLVDFGRRLGADASMLGVLAALPFLAQAVQLGTAAVYERHVAARGAITRRTLLAARLVWLLPAVLAFWPGVLASRLPAYLAIVFLSALLSTAGAHGWTSWMGDLVPAPVRGRYFGVRAAVTTAVAVGAGVGGGWLLDVLEARRGGLGFGAIYVLAAVAGVGAWIAFQFQHHPVPRAHPDVIPLRALWRQVWSKPENRRIFAFFAVWNASLGVAVPFWQDYMRTELHMKAWQIGLQNNLGAVVGIALAPVWGRLVDRAGVKPVLLLSATCIAAIPFLWLWSSPAHPWPVWVDAFFTGIVWTGFNLTALNLPLAAAPRRGAAVFLGVFAAVTGLAMGLSCLAGGVIAQRIGPGPHVVLGFPLAVHQVMFLMSGCLRVLAVPMALRLPDPRAKRVVFLFQMMGYAVRQRLNLARYMLSAPWRKRS